MSLLSSSTSLQEARYVLLQEDDAGIRPMFVGRGGPLGVPLHLHAQAQMDVEMLIGQMAAAQGRSENRMINWSDVGQPQAATSAAALAGREPYFLMGRRGGMGHWHRWKIEEEVDNLGDG